VPPPISATVITRNEEHRLPACLRSLHWVDEVVVLDSGSQDGTRAVAERAGARFFEHPWLGFAGQKNRAAALARHDWLLNVDADERVGADLRDAVRAAEFSVAGFAIPRVSDWMGRPHRPVHRPSPETLVRLYDRRRGAFGAGLVHEKVELDGPVGAIAGTLFHEGFRDLEDAIGRLNRYSSLLADERPGQGGSAARLVLRPLARLLWALVRHRNLRDGRRGYILAASWAFHDLLVEAKRYEHRLPAGASFDPALFAASDSERSADRGPREQRGPA